MNHTDFFENVIRLYQAARMPLFKHDLVARGRSRIITSSVEDLLASYFAVNLKGITKILVDQGFFGNKKRIYPDMSFFICDIVSSIVDLKMDIGWNRIGFYDFCKKQNDLILEIRGGAFGYSDGVNKKYNKCFFSDKIKYHIVILSNQNISARSLDSHLEKIKELDCIEVYVLSGDLHPNVYGLDVAQVLLQLEIRESEFDRLISNINAETMCLSGEQDDKNR